MPRAVIQFLLIHCVVALFAMREADRPPLGQIDRWFIDWLAGNAPRERRPAPLLLVELNDSSLEQIGWPLSPIDYSLYLQAVLDGHPSVIAIAPVAEWRREKASRKFSAQHLEILHGLVLRAPKLLVGARLGHREDPDVIPPVERVPILPHAKGVLDQIPEYEIVTRKPEEELSLSASVGFTNLRGWSPLVQRAPLVFRYRGQLVPSFVLQAAMLWLKLTPDDVVVVGGSHIEMGSKVRIPIDNAGTMLVDFPTPIARFGYDDLLLAVAQKDVKEAPFYSVERMKGALTLLARTDRLSRTLEFPDGRAASPGELFAEAIATIQNGTFYQRAPLTVDIGIAAVLGIIGCVFLRWRPTTIIITAVLLLPIYLFTAVTVFGAFRLWMPLALPSALTLFMTAYGLASPVRKPRQKSPPVPKPAKTTRTSA